MCKMKKAVFFDRDGTINVEKCYLYRIEDFEFMQGIPEVLVELRKRGYLLILITNQSGIARGYYTVEQMQRLHDYMQHELSKYNAQFDDIFFCPHYPKGRVTQYTMDCKCRKPGSLLFEQAVKKYEIAAELSYSVGDKERDLIPAKRMGMKCIKISNEKNMNWIVCSDLTKITKYID